MKNNLFFKFKIFYFLLLFGFTIFGVGYLYLSLGLKKNTVSNVVSNVPYEQSEENVGILLNVENEKIGLELLFESNELIVDFQCAGKYTYTINADLSFIEYLTDTVGGIELYYKEEYLRFTGSQITKLLVSNPELKRDITLKIVKGLAKREITKENLVYIITEYDTDLTYYKCFSWLNSLSVLCENVSFKGG